MGWGSRSPGRRDEHRSPRRRSRSRSSSRERGRRRYSRSRSRSRDRWREDRSRSRERRLRDSRSVSPPTHHHHYEQQHQQQYSSSSWQAGPEVPPWRQQQPTTLPGIAPLVVPAPWHNTDRMGGGSSHPHRGHQWERSRSRGSDTDRDWAEAEEQQQAHNRPSSGRHEVPSASVFIKGLPPDADEGDVITAFSRFANIQSVKVLRDRLTGCGKGTAFLDFASVDDARVLMQSDARYNTVVGGQPLYLDYSSGPPGGSSTAGLGGTAPGGGAVALDWICDRCTSVNFSRRLECYQCSTARPANPRRVASDLNEPSHILKVSGLEPHTSEEALYSALAAVVPNIVDMRVIKDKFTGAPRGFAFVELPSVSAAGTLMMACQGMMLRGQATPLKACYAKTKDRLLGSATTVEGPGGDAAAAATAAPWAGGGGAVSESQPHSASGPLGWKPKEFNPDGTASSGKQQQDGQLTGVQAAAAAAVAGGAPDPSAGAAGGGSSAAAAAAPAAAGPGPGSEADASGAAAAAAAGVDAATIQAMTQAGFQFQASSGYWWDPKSGYFYDTKTQLYYHHSTAQWYQYCHDTGQYTAVVSGADQQQQQQGLQQQKQPQKQASVADKRRRAVIGSAAQYNPEGLLAAAALAEEREAEQRRIAAAKAARERQQQQQNKGSSNNKKQQQMMPGKPGIGMLPGTGTSAAAFAAVASASAQVVEQGNVQGVVYRSKWQQRGAAQQ